MRRGATGPGVVEAVYHFDKPIWKVEQAGGYLVVSYGASGFSLMELGDDAILRGILDSETATRDIIVVGGYLYLLTEEGVSVVEIASAQQVSWIELEGFSMVGVGTHVYIRGESEVFLLDATDAGTPVLTGSFPMSRGGSLFIVRDPQGQVYLGEVGILREKDGIALSEIGADGSLTAVSDIETEEIWGFDVDAAGCRIALSGLREHITVIGVEDGGELVEELKFRESVGAWPSLSLVDNVLFAADRNRGLYRIGLPEQTLQEEPVARPSIGGDHILRLSEGFIISGSWDDPRLEYYRDENLSDGLPLELVGRPMSGAEGLGYFYLATTEGLSVYDLEAEGHPELLTSIPWPEEGVDLCVSSLVRDRDLLVQCGFPEGRPRWPEKLLWYDLEDPEHPRLVDEAELESQAYHMVRDTFSNLVYVALFSGVYEVVLSESGIDLELKLDGLFLQGFSVQNGVLLGFETSYTSIFFDDPTLRVVDLTTGVEYRNERIPYFGTVWWSSIWEKSIAFIVNGVGVYIFEYDEEIGWATKGVFMTREWLVAAGYGGGYLGVTGGSGCQLWEVPEGSLATLEMVQPSLGTISKIEHLRANLFIARTPKFDS